MQRRVLALDFDETIAENGCVPPALQIALERLHSFGYVLFLATGRRYGSVELGSVGNLFTGIVWENGAVLYHTAADDIYLPFGTLDARLVEALKAADVPLEEVASLFELLQILPYLPVKSLNYHLARNDFAKWAEGALSDEELAAYLRKLAHRHLQGEALREALSQRVANHYQELQALC